MTLETVIAQCKRLSSLRGYEKAKDELIRIAQKYGRDDTHLFNVITEILEVETMCPSPAALRGYLTAGAAKEDDRWQRHRACPFGLCPGDGWRVHYSLHTRTSNGTTKERITAEQAADLQEKIDQKKQTIYEAVGPCQCGGGPAIKGMSAQVQ